MAERKFKYYIWNRFTHSWKGVYKWAYDEMKRQGQCTAIDKTF